MIEFVRFELYYQITLRLNDPIETNLSYLSYKLIQIYNYYNRTKEII